MKAVIPLGLLIALVTTVVWWQGGRIDAANEQIGQSNQHIADLAQANMAQAAQLEQAARERAQAYALLQTLDAHIAALDANTQRSTHAVKDAIAIPMPGRPNCAAEPLPTGAVQLLQSIAPADNRDQTPAGIAPSGADASLP